MSQGQNLVLGIVPTRPRPLPARSSHAAYLSPLHPRAKFSLLLLLSWLINSSLQKQPGSPNPSAFITQKRVEFLSGESQKQRALEDG